MKKWILVALVGSVSFTACNNDDDDENQVNDTDRNYVNMASISNNAEVMAGQIAAAKGTNNLVKQYGQQMVTEHTAAQADLKNRSALVGLVAHDSIDAEHKALAVRLNALSGYSFDTAYMNSQVKDHQKTIDLFNSEINGGSAQTLRAYANQYLPHIQHHYNRADSIRKSL